MNRTSEEASNRALINLLPFLFVTGFGWMLLYIAISEPLTTIGIRLPGQGPVVVTWEPPIVSIAVGAGSYIALGALVGLLSVAGPRLVYTLVVRITVPRGPASFEDFLRETAAQRSLMPFPLMDGVDFGAQVYSGAWAAVNWVFVYWNAFLGFITLVFLPLIVAYALDVWSWGAAILWLLILMTFLYCCALFFLLILHWSTYVTSGSPQRIFSAVFLLLAVCQSVAGVLGRL